jgi:hypothetical protein
MPKTEIKKVSENTESVVYFGGFGGLRSMHWLFLDLISRK